MRRHRMLGASIHPFYRTILLRALDQELEMPSSDCQRLQNTLVKSLTDSGIWARMDYLYPLATHGLVTGTNGFNGINWIQPNNPLAISLGTVIPKKGIYGSFQTGFNINTHSIAQTMLPNIRPNQGQCIFAMLGAASGSITSVWTLMQNAGTINQQGVQTIRLRVTPSVDGLLNLPTANPVLVQSGLPVAQRLYTMDRVPIPAGGNGTFTIFHNATQASQSSGGINFPPEAANNLVVFGGVNHPVAIMGGGASIYYPTNYIVPLNAAIQNYFTALQTLP